MFMESMSKRKLWISNELKKVGQVGLGPTTNGL